MSIEITGIYIDDFRMRSEYKIHYEYETYTRELLREVEMKWIGNEVEISNFFTSMPGVYKIQLLQKKPGFRQNLYEMIGYYQVILYPSTNFRIQMKLNDLGIPETLMRINQTEYLFYGTSENSFLTVTAEYPSISTKMKHHPDQVKGDFLLLQYDQLPEMEKFVKDFLAVARQRLEKASAPEPLLHFLHGLNTQKQPPEDIHTYYSRLYNMLSSMNFNLTHGDLLDMDERQRIDSFIDRTGRCLQFG